MSVVYDFMSRGTASNVMAYVKPTNFCNVGCSHCYLTEEVRADKFLMSDTVLGQTIDTLFEMAIKQKSSSIMFLWHGGEPLTLPVSYFEKAGALIDKKLKDHNIDIPFMEAIQTSLIPFREEWVDVVKSRWGSSIGTSIDFSSRKLKGSSDAYQKLFMKKVDLARGNDIDVIPGIVPSKLEVGRAADIHQWFLDRDFPMFNIEKYNSFGGDFEGATTNLEHSMFMIELFDDSMKRVAEGKQFAYNNVMAACIYGVLTNSPGDRWGGSCMSDFLVVEPDGSTNNCPDKTSYEAAYSNIQDGYQGFANSPSRRKWIRVQQLDHKKDHCYTCENNTWCKSGCPITPNGPSEGQEECAGFKTFITHVRNFLKDESNMEIVSQYLNKRF